MQFTGPDLMVSKLQVKLIAVTENVFTESTLQRAAARLLITWPLLSYRTNAAHTATSKRAAKKASDGFMTIRNDYRPILPDIAGAKTEHGVTVYDANKIGELFDNNAISWHDRLRPRMFTIQAVAMQDATVFKFTMQHAAGDALGLYKAAVAFCEGLSGDVHKRFTNINRQYTFAGYKKTGSKWQALRSLLQTQQARDWYDICTSSKLFSIKALANKWQYARKNATRWKTIHFSRDIIENWQAMAHQAGVKVSKFNLIASWVHLNLEAFAQTLDPTTPERFAFTVSVRDFLKQRYVSDAEVWNPLSIAVVAPLPRGEAPKRTKLIAGGVNISRHVDSIRNPEYMQDYATLMERAPARQGQMKHMGKRTPTSIFLSSWSHAPFPDLEMWSDPDQPRRPMMVQPIISHLPSIPLPEKGGLDRQIAIMWEAKGRNGYWLTANLEDDLWRRIIDVSI